MYKQVSNRHYVCILLIYSNLGKNRCSYFFIPIGTNLYDMEICRVSDRIGASFFDVAFSIKVRFWYFSKSFAST